MIMITGRFQIDPEQREAFLAFARDLVPGERQEPGCLQFDMFEDVNTPNAFLMLEQWEDRDALDAHTETEKFEENDSRLESFILGEPSWDEYEF